MKVRKNNIGKAIVRFAAGAIVLVAVIVILITVILPKEEPRVLTEDPGSQTADNTIQQDPEEDPGIFADKSNAPDQTADPETGSAVGDTASVTGGTNEVLPGDTFAAEGENDPVIDTDPADEAEFNYPEFDDADDYDGDEFPSDEFTDEDFEDEIGEFGTLEEDAEPVYEPDPIVTPEPAPTPVPVASETCNSPVSAALKHPWKSDKATRVKNGVVTFETLTSDKGGSVIKIVGWSFGNWEGFNGKDNTTYVSVTNEKNETKYYDVQVSEGITGIEHTIKHGRNMGLADFICMIDVSSYPDGVYRLGSANRFKANGSWYSFAYTFGDDYAITVVGGVITARGGVEN